MVNFLGMGHSKCFHCYNKIMIVEILRVLKKTVVLENFNGDLLAAVPLFVSVERWGRGEWRDE